MYVTSCPRKRRARHPPFAVQAVWRLRRVQQAHALERQDPPDYTDEERGSRALPGPTFTLRGGEFGYPAEVELCTRFLYMCAALPVAARAGFASCVAHARHALLQH